jgi:hypothetical protein
VIEDDNLLGPDVIEPGEDGEPEPEHDNSADVKAVRKKKLTLAAERRESEEFWRKTFSSRSGRAEMWRIVSKTLFLRDETFACGPNGFPHPDATWYRAGAQDAARRLLEFWQILDFEGVHMMLCENDPRYANAKPPRKRGEV